MSWTFDRAAYERRVEWYVNARFGLFLHWGLYAIPGRGEWVRSDYPDLTFLDLGPDPRLYDPIDTVLEVELDGP